MTIHMRILDTKLCYVRICAYFSRNDPRLAAMQKSYKPKYVYVFVAKRGKVLILCIQQ